MNICLLRESEQASERRVALTPSAVRALSEAGHVVRVERNAGADAGFSDDEYEEAGGRIVHRRIEALAAAELVVGIGWVRASDVSALKTGAVVLSLHRLDFAPSGLRSAFAASGAVSVSADRLTNGGGSRPVIDRMSELSGALAPQIAARLLESSGPGRFGILLGGVTAVAPAEVVVVGAGRLGLEAARRFAATGAKVHLLDNQLARLEAVSGSLPANVSTLLSTTRTLSRTTRFANVLVMAVHSPNGAPPCLISEDMVRGMRDGAVIMDFAIDEGGSVATSRPIASPEDVYTVHGVLHFCMPNTPTLVARTASRMLSQVLRRYCSELASGRDPKAHPAYSSAVWWGDSDSNAGERS